MSGIARRLVDLFEGSAGLEPWSPPEMPAALADLLPWRAFDEQSELYVNAGSCGFMIELPPFAGIDTETLGALAGTLADAAPERCTVQVIHWASPRFGAALEAWAAPRARGGAVQAGMARGRAALLRGAGWRALHEGGPPFTLADYRVFIAATLAGPGGAGGGDRAWRLPPGARGHARLGRRDDAPRRAGRAAVARRRADRAGCIR